MNLQDAIVTLLEATLEKDDQPKIRAARRVLTAKADRLREKRERRMPPVCAPAVVIACRRCSVCVGQAHHEIIGWDEKFTTPVVHCKHCPFVRPWTDADNDTVTY